MASSCSRAFLRVSSLHASLVLDLALDRAGLELLHAPVLPQVPGDLLHPRILDRPDHLEVLAGAGEQLSERFSDLLAGVRLARVLGYEVPGVPPGQGFAGWAPPVAFE